MAGHTVWVTAARLDARSRILEAAWQLVRERRAADVTVAEIAGAAGVSRQLIYVHFDNRVGLFVAMARHHDQRSGFRDRVASARRRRPVPALEELLRLWFAYVPEILPVASALEAAAVAGEDGAAAVRDRLLDLREAFRLAVQRVADDGRLAAGWSVERATDWVWARSHLSSWQHLVGERGWSQREYARRATSSILAEVVRSPGRGGPGPVGRRV